MQEIPFTIPISGVIRLANGEITFIVNPMETKFSFVTTGNTPSRTKFGEGVSLTDIILSAARQVVSEKRINRFHPSELFHAAIEKHPGIKRGSFMARVVACTPDHPSYQHFASHRDYFIYGGKGLLMLKEQYKPDSNSENATIDLNGMLKNSQEKE
jgi:hypothetical protein